MAIDLLFGGDFMKQSITKYFEKCSIAEQTLINSILRKEEFERRDIYYPIITDESTLPWYFKTDYINKLALLDVNIVDFCPDCGKPEQLAEFIDETGFEQRIVTLKCPCGCIYQYGG